MDNELILYAPFIKEIKELIYRHQYEAMKKVNVELLLLYWRIGGEIARKQQEQGWGKSVVEILSKELQKEFPGVRGFTVRNLWFMRQFYTEYATNSILKPMVSELAKTNENSQVASKSEILKPLVSELDNQNLPPLVGEISWSKNLVIIQKCKDPMERIFYIKSTRRFGWTKDVLINNIENKTFERYLTNQTSFDDAVAEKYRLQAKLAVKDEYNFDFLEMGEAHREAELETAIVNKIRAFLIEMGGHYTFVGNQFHLDVAGDESYVDILLFHRQLRSLIAIELKVGEFIPEYTGKMQYYLAVLNDTVKLPDENPSIGIIICKSKSRTRVEYALNLSNAPIGVATYTFHDQLPKDLQSLLPSPDEIERIVQSFDDSEVGLFELTDSGGDDDE